MRKENRMGNVSKALDIKNVIEIVEKDISEAISKHENSKWENFIAKQGDQPLSSRPYWRRINRIKGNTMTATIPTLKTKVNNVETAHKTDHEKANVFGKRLFEIFNVDNNTNFNSEREKEVRRYIDKKM